MSHIESPDSSPAESYHTRVNRESATMNEREEINGVDTILLGAPAPLAVLELHSVPAALPETKVSRQDRHVVAALSEPARKSADLNHRATLFLEGIVGLHNF